MVPCGQGAAACPCSTTFELCEWLPIGKEMANKLWRRKAKAVGTPGSRSVAVGSGKWGVGQRQGGSLPVETPGQR